MQLIKSLFFTLIYFSFALTLLNAPDLFGQGNLDFTRADKQGLPKSGVWKRIMSGRDVCLGYIPGSRSIFFKTGWDTGLRGGPPIIKVVSVNIDSGARKREFDPDEDKAWKSSEQTLVPPDESIPATWGKLTAIARPMTKLPSRENFHNNLESTQASGDVEFTFYLRHEETGWLKPLHRAWISVSLSGWRPSTVFSKEPVNSTGIWQVAGPGVIGLLLKFRILPYDNWAQDSTMHIYASSQVVAQFLNEVGFVYYRKKNFQKALQIFNQALQTDAGHVTAIYNAACVAALQEDVDTALNFLRMLKANNSQLALGKLKKVDSDADFNFIRSHPKFLKELELIRNP